MKTLFFTIKVLFVCIFSSLNSLSAESISIIPIPVKMDLAAGHFHLSATTQLVIDDENGSFANEVFYFQHFIKSVTGKHLSPAAGNNSILIRKCTDCEDTDSYRLHITAKEIIISSGNAKGVFYAIQTLKQLIVTGNEAKGASIPALSIYDYPAYEEAV